MTTQLPPTPVDRPPLFSVVIPTRDRPALLERAVRSVLAQRFGDVEIVIVDDGSSQQAGDPQGWAAPGRIRVHQLAPRPAGHGPAFARNAGAALARGRYLCFLDDDDLWIDDDHLQRAHDALTRPGPPVDLYFTDQRAVAPDGTPSGAAMWLHGLERLARGAPDDAGHRRVQVDELLQAPGFAHLNCSIYRRGLYEALRGMDETLRYENDRDLYLRAIDAAQVVLYNPAIVARHHIPDPVRRANVSTAVSQLEKALFQLRICDKAILHARHGAIRHAAWRAKGYTLKRIVQLLDADGRPQEARRYMREALVVGFSFKWLGYTLLKSLQPGRLPAGHAPRTA